MSSDSYNYWDDHFGEDYGEDPEDNNNSPGDGSDNDADLGGTVGDPDGDDGRRSGNAVVVETINATPSNPTAGATVRVSVTLRNDSVDRQDYSVPVSLEGRTLGTVSGTLFGLGETTETVTGTVPLGSAGTGYIKAGGYLNGQGKRVYVRSPLSARGTDISTTDPAPGQEVTVSGTWQNEADTTLSRSWDLTVNGSTVSTHDLTFRPGATRTVTETVTIPSGADEFEISLGGGKMSFSGSVRDGDTSDSDYYTDPEPEPEPEPEPDTGGGSTGGLTDTDGSDSSSGDGSSGDTSSGDTSSGDGSTGGLSGSDSSSGSTDDNTTTVGEIPGDIEPDLGTDPGVVDDAADEAAGGGEPAETDGMGDMALYAGLAAVGAAVALSRRGS